MAIDSNILLFAACDILSPRKYLHEYTYELINTHSQIWPELITLTSEELVLPAVYQSLLKKLPEEITLDPELVEYLEVTLDLNEERNGAIAEQITNLSQTISKCGAEAIFSKGASHIIEPPCKEWEGRVVGDIDVIVSKDHFYSTIKALLEAGYSTVDNIWYYDYRSTQHYAPLAHKDYIAIVEVHEYPVTRHLQPPISFEQIRDNARAIDFKGSKALIPSNTFRVLHNILHAQISDAGFYAQRFPLRQLHDFSLLTQLPDIQWQEIEEQFPGPLQREMLHSYLQRAEKYFGWAYPETIKRKHSIIFKIRENYKNIPAIQKLTTVALAAIGALSKERIFSHYCSTRSQLQLFGFRIKHVLRLIKKMLSETSRKVLLNTSQKGTVETLIKQGNVKAKNYGTIHFDDSSLIVHKTSGYSYLVNNTAGLIADDIIAGHSIEEIAQEISQQSALPLEEATADVILINSLLSNEHEKVNLHLDSPDCLADFSQTQDHISTSIAVTSDILVIIEHPKSISDVIEYCCSKLPNCSLAAKHRIGSIVVVESNDSFCVKTDSNHCNCCSDLKTLPSLIFSLLQVVISEAVEHSIALHGGAIEKNGKVALILGDSGSGKTTFLAKASQNGYQVIADDLLLLSREATSVHVMPTPFGIKSGSWSELQIDPSEENIFLHPHGSELSYLSIESKLEGYRQPISCIIFPEFKTGNNSNAQSLSKSQTLEAISRAGFNAPTSDYLKELRLLASAIDGIPSIYVQHSSYKDLEKTLEQYI